MLSRRMLVDKFIPQRLIRTSDNVGHYTESWADEDSFKGRLSSVKTEERLNADKTTVYATHKVYCDIQDIDESYRLKCDSTIYQIVGIVKPSNLSTGHMEIMVKEVS